MAEEQEPKTRLADPYRAARQFERMIFHGVPEDLRRPPTFSRKFQSKEGWTRMGTIIYDREKETVTYEHHDGSKVIDGPDGRQIIEATNQNKDQE
jgi:hypothetical protein